MKGSRAMLLVAATLAAGVALAACGAGGPATGGASTGGSSTAAASSSGAAGRPQRQTNAAQQAAGEIIRVQPVVPFSQAQIKKLVPMLQALATNPNLSAAQLTTKGQQIEAVFTATQQEALKNMGSRTATFGGAFGRGSGTGAAGGGVRFRRSGTSASGGGPAPVQRSGTSAAGGARPGFGAGGIYQLAIQVLQGKVSPPSGGVPGAAAAGAGAGAAAGAVGAQATAPAK